MKLSILVPAYNEAQRIRPFLDAYVAYFSERYGPEVELLVIVNGSTDGTEAVVGEYVREGGPVRVLVEPRPVGKGGALMWGFKEARGDLVGFVDADGATPPVAFQALVDQIGDAGAVIACRWHADSDIAPQPLSRRIASRIFNVLVRLLFRLPISDTQCGAKLMRREAVAAVAGRLGITRWAFDVDLLFQLRRAGYRIIERPTVWHDVSGSRVRIVRASAEMLLAITRLRLIYSRLRWVVTAYDRTLGRLIHRK